MLYLKCFAGIAALVCIEAASAQTLTKEYIRFNGSVVAIENAALGQPGVVSLAPSSGGGPSAVFTGVFSDSGGASHLKSAQFNFYSSAGNCHAGYFPGQNLIELDDANAGWTWSGGSGPPGGTGQPNNGVCSIALSGSTATTNGNNLTVALGITFASTAYGTFTLQTMAEDTSLNNTGWVTFGSWSAQANSIVSAGSIAGVLAGRAALAKNTDGRLEAVARWNDDSAVDISQTSVGGAWGSWTWPGGDRTSILYDPAVVRNTDGRLQAFAVGGGNQVWTTEQNSPGQTWQNYWTSLGGSFASRPTTAVNADGTVLVMAVNSANAVWYTSQTSPDGSFQAYWTQISGPVGIADTPVIVKNANGLLEAFARGTDSYTYHAWQMSVNGSWSAWASLASGYTLSNPAAAVDANGLLEVFIEGGDGALWHIWQTAPSTWNTYWASLGGGINGDPSVGTDSNGGLEVFVKGTDNGLWYTAQSSPGSSWSGFSRIAGDMMDVSTVVLNANNELEAFYRASTDGLLHYITQVSPGVWPAGPYANYQICSNIECFTSGAVFSDGASFTLVVSSNIPSSNPSSSFTMHIAGYAPEPNYGQTDSTGNWYQPGSFTPTGTYLGTWQEWVEFPGVATSNVITFTVQP